MATDVMFRSGEALARAYPDMVRHSVMDMGCADVLHFLGRWGTIQQCVGAEVKSSILTRHEGTRCKHSLNSNSIKMYDKQESVLRIETTINDPRDMKAFRTKEGDPEGELQWSRMRKGVCDRLRPKPPGRTGGALMAAHRRSLVNTQTLYAAALTWLLLSTPFVVAGIVRLIPALPIPVYLLATGVAALAVAPVSLIPLALAWNRVR